MMKGDVPGGDEGVKWPDRIQRRQASPVQVGPAQAQAAGTGQGGRVVAGPGGQHHRQIGLL